MKKITFCIPTCKNEKDYIALLLDSMESNFDSLEHEVIIFIDSDNQNTYEFLKQRDNKFKDIRILKNKLPVPICYQRNVNIMFELAKHDIVSMIQSDMVVGKHYDTEILRHLKDEHTIVSATRVEPSLHPPSPEKYTKDLGLSPDEFDWSTFNTFVTSNTDFEKVTHYWFAPFTLYKQRWLEIGGHDTLFRRSREDSDILMRLRLNGCNIIQTWSALVYHFTCVSSRGKGWFKEENQNKTKLQQVADSFEMNKYIRKWKSFEHGAEPIETDKYLYRCSISLKECKAIMVEHIIHISQFFDKVYIDDIDTLNKVVDMMEKKSIPANQLFGYTEDQWLNYSKYFRTYDYNDIFRPGFETNDNNIIITVNAGDINNQDRFNFLMQLNNIIHHQTEPDSKFEYDIFNIEVKEKINSIKDNIVVSNPKIRIEDVIEEVL